MKSMVWFRGLNRNPFKIFEILSCTNTMKAESKKCQVFAIFIDKKKYKLKKMKKKKVYSPEVVNKAPLYGWYA